MANDYYNSSGWPATSSTGTSSPARAELTNITAGFAKLPALTGNGSKAVVVNAGGTALTVTTGTLALAGNLATTGAFNTTFVQGATVSITLPTVTGLTLATITGTETLTNKTLTNPVVAQVNDANGNEALKLTATGSAVNEVTIANAATTADPVISATGETNVGLQISPKGTGTAKITDGTDTTKKVAFDVSGVTTATTRTITVGDADFTLRTATGTEQETASAANVVVTPSIQHRHVSAAKAWVNFNSAGAVAASYNITSITDSGVGDWTVNIATDFSSTSFVGVVTGGMTNPGTLRGLICNIASAPTAGAFQIRAFDGIDAVTLRDPTDPDQIHAVFFGDQ